MKRWVGPSCCSARATMVCQAAPVHRGRPRRVLPCSTAPQSARWPRRRVDAKAPLSWLGANTPPANLSAVGPGVDGYAFRRPPLSRASRIAGGGRWASIRSPASRLSANAGRVTAIAAAGEEPTFWPRWLVRQNRHGNVAETSGPGEDCSEHGAALGVRYVSGAVPDSEENIRRSVVFSCRRRAWS